MVGSGFDDANYGVFLPTESNRFPDDCRIRAEPPPPKRFTDESHFRGIKPVVVIAEYPSKQRPGTQRPEHAGCGYRSQHQFRRVIACEPVALNLQRAHLVERSGSRLPVRIIRRRHRAVFDAKNEALSQTSTRRPGSVYGSGRSSTLFNNENTAVFAPIPNASVRTATVVKPGDLARDRAARRSSGRKSAMLIQT